MTNQFEWGSCTSMSGYPEHPRLNILDPVVAGLDAAAAATERLMRKNARRARAQQGYEALRPGSSTPLWNELADACVHQLQRRGDKVRLARLLGISRQRLHLLLVARTACPDAERALQLALWLRARRAGQEPA